MSDVLYKTVYLLRCFVQQPTLRIYEHGVHRWRLGKFGVALGWVVITTPMNWVVNSNER